MQTSSQFSRRQFLRLTGGAAAEGITGILCAGCCTCWVKQGG